MQILADQNGIMGNMMQDLAFAIPGVDEAMGFAEIMKCATVQALLRTEGLTQTGLSSRWNFLS